VVQKLRREYEIMIVGKYISLAGGLQTGQANRYVYV
jgi:hypothetical protein